jgi:hypothetical protein
VSGEAKNATPFPPSLPNATQISVKKPNQKLRFWWGRFFVDAFRPKRVEKKVSNDAKNNVEVWGAL